MMRDLLIPRFGFGREFDEIFGSIFGAPAEGRWMPSVECYEKDGKLEVRLDLPGVDPKDVEVSLDGTMLVIRGERRSERTEDDGYREVRYGSFERRFTVPKGIDVDKAVARYENGVLSLTLPLPESAKVKRIPINAAAAIEAPPTPEAKAA
jgi:HSP20 family protein